MNTLVTGGAGYIGSIVTEELIKAGNSVVVVDNLNKGHREAVSPEADFVQADLADRKELDRIFDNYQVDAVIHLAAESVVPESMSEPEKFFTTNVTGGINLLNAMLGHGVTRMIFSGSAAVYGEPAKVPVKESDPAAPVNPYGETKLMFEKILHWYGYVHGLNFIALRYFNAAGASARYGESHEPVTHLITIILEVALGQREKVTVFGTDYPTPDGSCIRDYIHVLDIARAHIIPLKKLGNGKYNKAYNLGSGKGSSVLEVIETARKVTGVPIPSETGPRRAGDPAVLVADSELIRTELGWQPEFPELETIIESAWKWHQEHPHGYG